MSRGLDMSDYADKIADRALTECGFDITTLEALGSPDRVRRQAALNELVKGSVAWGAREGYALALGQVTR